MSQAEVVSQALTSSPTTLRPAAPLQPRFTVPDTCLSQDSALAALTATLPPQCGSFPPFNYVFLTMSSFQGTFLSEGWHPWLPYLKLYPPHLKISFPAPLFSSLALITL